MNSGIGPGLIKDGLERSYIPFLTLLFLILFIAIGLEHNFSSRQLEDTAARVEKRLDSLENKISAIEAKYSLLGTQQDPLAPELNELKQELKELQAEQFKIRLKLK